MSVQKNYVFYGNINIKFDTVDFQCNVQMLMKNVKITAFRLTSVVFSN